MSTEATRALLRLQVHAVDNFWARLGAESQITRPRPKEIVIMSILAIDSPARTAKGAAYENDSAPQAGQNSARADVSLSVLRFHFNSLISIAAIIPLPHPGEFK